MLIFTIITIIATLLYENKFVNSLTNLESYEILQSVVNSHGIYPLTMTITKKEFIMVLNTLHIYRGPHSSLQQSNTEYFNIILNCKKLYDPRDIETKFVHHVCSGKSCEKTKIAMILFIHRGIEKIGFVIGDIFHAIKWNYLDGDTEIYFWRSYSHRYVFIQDPYHNNPLGYVFFWTAAGYM